MVDRFLKPLLFVTAVSLFVWIIVGFVIYSVNKKNGRKISNKAEWLLFIFYLYIVCVLTLTVIPMPFNRLEDSEGGINIVPLVNTIINSERAIKWPNFPFARHTFQNVIGNIILFIPLGIFVPFFSYKYRSLPHVIVLAFICSCSIEITQLIERFFGIYRFVDIDDVILNTTGAILGFVIINNIVLKHDKTPGKSLKNW